MQVKQNTESGKIFTEKFGMVNPEIDQDRVFDTTDHFDKFGYVMFPEQVAIYKNIAKTLFKKDSNVLDVGCGNGLGAGILDRFSGMTEVTGVDKLASNVKFAQCMYPWIKFAIWDINYPISSLLPDDSYFTLYLNTGSIKKVVTCIETIEHVSNPQEAINNLLEVATEEVWLSTPNGAGKPRPPENPYHVCEYTPEEMLDMIGSPQVGILHWKTFKPLPIETEVDPLVYRICL